MILKTDEDAIWLQCFVPLCSVSTSASFVTCCLVNHQRFVGNEEQSTLQTPNTHISVLLEYLTFFSDCSGFDRFLP